MSETPCPFCGQIHGTACTPTNPTDQIAATPAVVQDAQQYDWRGTVRVGQLWLSNDVRDVCRYKRVVAIEGAYARMQPCDHNGHAIHHSTTKVRLDRFRNTSRGYVLMQEATDE